MNILVFIKSILYLLTAKPILKLPVGVKGDEMCGVCETVVQYVDSLLEENSTITEIEQVIEKVCNFLPDNLRQEVSLSLITYELFSKQSVISLHLF